MEKAKKQHSNNEKSTGVRSDVRPSISKQKVFTKILSLVLAVLVTFFMIPSASYAAIIDTAAELGSGADGGADAIPSYHPTYENLPVAYEEYSMREESVKHFRLADGTYVAAQYPEPVHYLDDDGAWQDIDNRITESGSELTVPGGRIKFAKKITGNETLFTLHENGAKITMSLVGANKKTEGAVTSDHSTDGGEETELGKMLNLEYLNSSVLYEEILDGVDLEYVVSSLNVKENIIVKEKNAEGYSYSFELKLNNLTAELSSDGNVYIRRHTGDEAYVIPAPIVYDGEGACAPYDAAAYTLESLGNGSYILTVTASSEWMNAEERVYPVTVDPTIGTSASYSSSYVEDTYVSCEDTFGRFGQETKLLVSAEHRAYVKLRTLPKLPGDAYITNATVNMYGSSAAYIGAYELSSGWGENLSWYDTEYHYDCCLVTPSRGEFTRNLLDCVQPLELGYHSFDITEAAVGWYNGGNCGVGFAMVSGAGICEFKSSENGTSTIPTFTFSYANAGGLEDYYSYSSHSAGTAGAGSVSLASGNLIFTIPTLTASNGITSITPTLVYNSAITYYDFLYGDVPGGNTGAFTAYAMRLNLQETLVKDTVYDSEGALSTVYIFTDSDGTEHCFTQEYNRKEDGSLEAVPNRYCDNSGLRMSLCDSNTSAPTIEYLDGTVKTFSRSPSTPSGTSMAWHLSKITDRSNNAIQLVFDSQYRPTAVQFVPNGGPAMNMLTLYYYGNVLNVVIDEAAGVAAVLRYSDTGSGSGNINATRYMTKLEYVYADGNMTADDWASYYVNGAHDRVTVYSSAEYFYDSQGRMSRARDLETGRSINYIYGYRGKVTSVEEHNREEVRGQTVHIDYYSGYTEVTTSGTDDDIFLTADNVITRYTFDEYARVKSSYSTNYARTVIYGAVSGVYETQENVKNSIDRAVSVGGSQTSYLLNGDFESGSLIHWNATDGVKYNYSQTFADVLKGYACAQLTATPDGGEEYISQTLFLPEGEYTFSVSYITLSNPKAKVAFKVINASSGDVIASKRVGSFATAYNNATAESITFSVPDTASGSCEIQIGITASHSGEGTLTENVFIDNAILTGGAGVKEFNVVDGGNFESVYVTETQTAEGTVREKGYLQSLWTGNYSIANVTGFGGVAMLRSNGPATKNSISQSVFTIASTVDGPNRNKNAKIVYSVSAFGYASSVVQDDDAHFGIRVKVYYLQNSGDNVIVEHFFPFGKSDGQWQFVSGSFSGEYVPEDENDNAKYICITKIEVICEYSGQDVGAYAYFDNINVEHELFVPSDKNIYDDNGNVITYCSPEGNTYYKYNEYNDVVEMANDFGDYVEYFYDNHRNLAIIQYYSFRWKYKDTEEYLSSTQYKIDNKDGAFELVYVPKYRVFNSFNSYGLLLRESISIALDTATKESFTTHLNPEVSTTYTYNLGNANWKVFGTPESEISADGSEKRYIYYRHGLLRGVVNMWEVVTESGDVIKIGDGIQYSYDRFGVIEAVQPLQYSSGSIHTGGLLDEVRYGYGSEGYLDYIKTYSTQYDFSYDNFGNTDTVSIGSAAIADYDYNSYNGKLNKITYGNGFAVRYVYDSLDNVSEIWYTLDGTESKVYEYKYTTGGQLYSITDIPNKTVTVYEYDYTERLVGVNEYSTEASTDSSPEDYYYNTASRITYDDESRVTNYDLNITVGTVGRMRSVTSNTTYRYDLSGKLVSLSAGVDGELGQSFTYGGYDRVEKIVNSTAGGFYNEVSYDYADNSSWKIDSYTSKAGTSASNTARTYDYEYDHMGNITSITVDDDKTVYYVYDVIGQLIRENNQLSNVTYVYDYDNAGNIQTVKRYAYTLEEDLYHLSPSYTEYYEYDGSDWGDKLKSYNGHNIEYDEIGNPISYYNGSSYSFEWEGRRLKTATKGNQNFTFTYNVDGIRTSKTVNGVEHTYILDGAQIAAEIWGSRVMVYVYDVYGAPIGMQYYVVTDSGLYEGYSYWFEKNLQGDVIAVYDEDGTKLIEYTYDTWGNHSAAYYNGGADSAAVYNPFRYRGYYYDEDLGLYYLQSRYYDSNTGRFISPDSLDYLGADGDLTSYNLYDYCGNNPVMYSDPSGHIALSTLLIGYAISSFIAWGLSELLGAQMASGIGSISGGGTAVSTGVNLLAFGPWGVVAGITLIVIGGTTIAFGANEIVDGITGTNHIQDWIGWDDERYNGVYRALNIASSVGSIAGNVGARIASNNILNNIVKNPKRVQQYQLWQIKTYGRCSSQYIPGTLRKGEHIGQGYNLTNVGGAPKGYIQWHPGSRHHFNGRPYWKVSSSLGGTWRG